MAIETGTRIGAYRITGLIGAGGMGEVYRAKDERLGRDVAIKILGSSATGPGFRERLEREARLLASINHPHIGSIYGVEDVDGTPALVLELIEGSTLAERLREGSLPIATAIALAKQIADALAAAHEKGIIHRDLKPSNIVVTPSGQAKVLDFGLAKSIDPVPNEANTRTASLTREGTVMGTAAYMSPEQARGSKVDEQADIWAFGCVLFEMIAGTRAFDGATSSDVIAAILKSDPDWNLIPAGTPANVVRVIRRCLDKDPKRRQHSIADARIDLEDTNTAPVAAGGGSRRGLRNAVIAAAVIAAAILGAAAAASLLPRSAAPSRAITRFVVDAGQPPLVDGTGVAISADGQMIAYPGTNEGLRRLYVRRLDAPDARALVGSEGGSQPFFSPDGQWVGFFAGGKLRKTPVASGTSEIIADAPSSRGGAWGPDDTIIFSPRPDGPLFRVSASGGTPQPATKLGDREGSHRYPQFLPNGHAIIYASGPPGSVTLWSEAKIVAEDLVSGARTIIAPRGSSPRFIAPGHLAFVQFTQLHAVPIDVNTLATTGPPIQLDDHVSQIGSGFAQYDISPDGTLVSAPSSYVPSGALALVDRQGVATSLNIRAPFQSEARISPDGSKIAYTGATPDAEVWIYDVASKSSRQLTSGGSNVWPEWSPDGKRIAYGSFRSGVLSPFVRDLAGGPEQELNKWGAPQHWLRDGSAIGLLFPRLEADQWLLDMGSNTPRPMPSVRPRDSAPKFSPDGRRLAAVSFDSGRGEVVVFGFPDTGERIQVSTAGGNEPVWSHDGRALFFRRGIDMMMVDVLPGSPLRFSAPRLLFKGEKFSGAGNRANFDVMPDGQHFLMVLLDEPRPVLRLTATLNWADSIHGKLPR